MRESRGDGQVRDKLFINSIRSLLHLAILVQLFTDPRSVPGNSLTLKVAFDFLANQLLAQTAKAGLVHYSFTGQRSLYKSFCINSLDLERLIKIL